MPVAAGEGAGREPGVGGDLRAVGEGPVQRLAHQHGRQLEADAAEPGEQAHLGRVGVAGRRFHGRRVAPGLDRLDLLEYELQALEPTFDLPAQA